MVRARLSFDWLESRDMLSGTVALTPLPLPSLGDGLRSFAAAPVLIQMRLPSVPAVVEAAVPPGGDHEAPAIIASDERPVLLVFMPPELTRVPDAWHDGDHAILEHDANPPAAPAPAISRPPAGPTDTLPVETHANLSASAPAETPPVTNASSPLVGTAASNPASLPFTWFDTGVAVVPPAAAVDPVPAGAGAFAVGVPGPAPIFTAADAISSTISVRTSFAEPPAVPWLADLLTPTTQTSVGDPLFALERFVAEAQGWTQALVNGLSSALLSALQSPWLVGTTAVIAAAEMCRRRWRRSARPVETAVDVPQVTRPSQWI